jgi:D-alanyl-D-alanine carboxypeptidase/D-alanyl-D-alanine-endopeptidase (penicillin-binding protein 4)
LGSRIGRWLGLCLAAVVTSSAASELPEDIARIVRALDVSPDDVSVVVQEVHSSEPLLAYLPDEPRNPASVMKLVTTWAALEMLGPAYVWPTEVHFRGSFNGRTLTGDLALKGYGDPFLVHEELWKLLRALRRTGLETIEGDLVLDDSYFDVDEPDPGEFDSQPFRTYNVVPSALLVNLKAIEFQFRPNPATRGVDITTEPIIDGLRIDNSIELIEGRCGGFQRGISFNVPDEVRADRIIFDGSFARSCSRYSLTRTAMSHAAYTHGLFTSLWREVGGRFSGGVRREKLPEDADPSVVWASRPLGDVVKSINKNSNNVMTRQLLYTMGAARFGEPATRENGVAAIEELLVERGLDVSSLNVVNGAGLSRDVRVSAQLLVDLLRMAEQGPYAAEYISSLSIGGLDGTTRGRVENGNGNGVTHLKTGRVDHVSALAGYAHGHDGRMYALAVLINAPEAHRGPGGEIENAVLRWVFAQDR